MVKGKAGQSYLPITSFNAGQALALGNPFASDGPRPGCLARGTLLWCLFEALVTGQTSELSVASKSGCEGGRMVLVVPTTGQIAWVVAIVNEL